jgi:diguanylate cyclase
LREVCRQARSWRDAGLAPIPVAISISAIEWHAESFVESVGAILRETDMDPRCLELEITEPILVKSCHYTFAVVRALRKMGVRVALDHFGTGTSSLTQLARFPVDALRIDESLVRGLGAGGDHAGIVNAVISAGTSFHMQVIAQGIGTQEQFLGLQGQHCKEGLGHYFRDPVSGHEFAKLLEVDARTTAEA